MNQRVLEKNTTFGDWQEGEEELRVELEETLVDMLSEEEEDEEIDGGDVGLDNDTDLDMEMWSGGLYMKLELFSQTLSRQATSH